MTEPDAGTEHVGEGDRVGSQTLPGPANADASTAVPTPAAPAAPEPAPDPAAAAQSLPLDLTAAAFARLGEAPETGDPRVDDAVARLRELPDLPVGEHLSVYQDIHRRLHDVLADLDAG